MTLKPFTGGGEDIVQLGHRISRAWTNFAKTGVPSAESLPTWEPWPHTLVLDQESKLG